METTLLFGNRRLENLAVSAKRNFPSYVDSVLSDMVSLEGSVLQDECHSVRKDKGRLGIDTVTSRAGYGLHLRVATSKWCGIILAVSKVKNIN